MPFTFSHPAAALPLRRYCPRYLVFSALALGTVTPDLGYFVFRFPEASFAHALIGSFLLDLPLGFILWILARGWKPKIFAGSVFKAIPSIWIGAFSHLVWDAFTHQRGLFGELPWISGSRVHLFGTSIYLYEILQHGSSLLGMAALAIYFRRGILKYWRSWRPNFRKLVPALAFLAVAIQLSFWTSRGHRPLESRMFYFIVAFVDFIAAGGLIYGVSGFFSTRFSFGKTTRGTKPDFESFFDPE